MVVSTHTSMHEVATESDLRRALGETYLDHNGKRDSNEFRIQHGEYPMLVIARKADLAFVNYLEKAGDPGYVATPSHTRARGTSSVYIAGEYADMPNELLVPWSVAIEVACEFLQTESMPRSVLWQDLSEPN